MSTAPAPQRDRYPGFTRLIPCYPSRDWTDQQARDLCRYLELGDIAFFANSPIDVPSSDREFLLRRKQSSSSYHKNVAYRPAEDRLSGIDSSDPSDSAEVRRVLRDYSARVTQFLSGFLSLYAAHWKLDFASFRPIEEQGRPARLHARNDLLHFDSFPTRPTNGGRILRFFTNINPSRNRVWLTSQTFESFGPQFARKTGLLSSLRSPFSRALRSISRLLLVPGAQRPPYDELMRRCHNAMKEDSLFQDTTPKYRWEFPSNSSWIVFTDCVSHAVLSGQFALEQTFLIPQCALVDPQRSPLAILENLAGTSLTL
jgi:hypothetical protein